MISTTIYRSIAYQRKRIGEVHQISKATQNKHLKIRCTALGNL